jgi:hypothetical protein
MAPDWRHNITYKGFTYNDFTYDINKCDSTYMFLFRVMNKVIYK